MYYLVNHSFAVKREDYKDYNAIREYMLQKGLVSIVDETIATKEEIEAQDIAKKFELRCWKAKEDSGYVENNGRSKEDWSAFDLVN